MRNRWGQLPQSVRDRVRIPVLERDGYRCQIRGPKCTGRASDVDHIVSLKDGGALLDPDNLRAACPACNRGRRPGATSRSVPERSAGAFVADPSLPYGGCPGDHPAGGSVPCPRCGCCGPSRAW